MLSIQYGYHLKQLQGHGHRFQLVQPQPDGLLEGIGPVGQLAFGLDALHPVGAVAKRLRRHGGEQQAHQQGAPERQGIFPGRIHGARLTAQDNRTERVITTSMQHKKPRASSA